MQNLFIVFTEFVYVRLFRLQTFYQTTQFSDGISSNNSMSESGYNDKFTK